MQTAQRLLKSTASAMNHRDFLISQLKIIQKGSSSSPLLPSTLGANGKVWALNSLPAPALGLSYHLLFNRTESSLSRLFANPTPLPSQQYPFIMPTVVPIVNPLQRIRDDQRLPSRWTNIEKLDPLLESLVPVEVPTPEHIKIRKSAARLVRIRRSKMKKHQYRKLKKRYGHVWEYYRKRRKLRRVKVFYGEQELIIKTAKEFDPEVYVKNFIATAKACQDEEQAALAKRKQSYKGKPNK